MFKMTTEQEEKDTLNEQVDQVMQNHTLRRLIYNHLDCLEINLINPSLDLVLTLRDSLQSLKPIQRISDHDAEKALTALVQLTYESHKRKDLNLIQFILDILILVFRSNSYIPSKFKYLHNTNMTLLDLLKHTDHTIRNKANTIIRYVSEYEKASKSNIETLIRWSTIAFSTMDMAQRIRTHMSEYATAMLNYLISEAVDSNSTELLQRNLSIAIIRAMRIIIASNSISKARKTDLMSHTSSKGTINAAETLLNLSLLLEHNRDIYFRIIGNYWSWHGLITILKDGDNEQIHSALNGLKNYIRNAKFANGVYIGLSDGNYPQTWHIRSLWIITLIELLFKRKKSSQINYNALTTLKLLATKTGLVARIITDHILTEQIPIEQIFECGCTLTNQNQNTLLHQLLVFFVLTTIKPTIKVKFDSIMSELPRLPDHSSLHPYGAGAIVTSPRIWPSNSTPSDTGTSVSAKIAMARTHPYNTQLTFGCYY